jgi:hypothetical protein
MPISVLVVFLLLGGAGAVCGAFAASNARRPGRYSVLGIFGGREVFTPRGWRYRNWSLALLALAFLVLFAWAGLQGWRARRNGARPRESHGSLKPAADPRCATCAIDNASATTPLGDS